MQAQQSNKQGKCVRCHAGDHPAKAAEMRDTEAAGKWQKVQYRSKEIVKGAASRKPATVTPLLSAKWQGAVQNNKPKGSESTLATIQRPTMSTHTLGPSV